MSRKALVLLVCCCDFRDGAERLIPSKSLRNAVIRAFPGLLCILRMCAPRRAAAVVRPREREKSADRRRRILISRLLIIRASVPRRKSPFPAYFKGFPAVSPLIPPYPTFLKYPVSPQPVVRDGETVAILYGVVPLQELSKNYEIDLYNGNAFLLVVDGNNGDILLDTWHDSLGNLSELRGRKMLKGFTYEQAMENIPKGIGGDMCTVSQSTGLTIYLHYEPVGINNWSVVLGVSEAEALAGTRGVVETLSMMAIIVTALLLSYLGFMVWYLTSARRGVYRMSITDQGTGLMNRVAYEKCLRKNDQRVIAPAACIYIDANGLHEINNERGHEAGDQLLRAVAERLREQFPRDDLYRVGGDEFVVFPAPAAEAEYEARMRAVSESLAAQGYSISYGIAVCEAANGLRELVREADEKMLGSKRAYYAEHDRRRLR